VGTLAFVVGYDGQAYLTGLAARNEATITLPDGRTCQASFAHERPADGLAASLGRVACVAAEPAAVETPLPETGAVKRAAAPRPMLRGALP
ncbi:FimD/PapC C-terminal domain-containing protein, partial [Nostoc sp. NIES-2111]